MSVTTPLFSDLACARECGRNAAALGASAEMTNARIIAEHVAHRVRDLQAIIEGYRSLAESHGFSTKGHK